MHRPCTSGPSAIFNSRISSWTNYAPGYAAPNRCCGSGWPSTLARRFFPCSIWAPAHKTLHTCSSLRVALVQPQARGGKLMAQEVGQASLQSEIACPDCPLTINPPKGDLQRLNELSTM